MRMYSNSSIDEFITSDSITENPSKTLLNSTVTESVSTTPPPITSTELSIVNFTIGTVGIAGNIFVIIVILASSVLSRQVNVMFIVNQSVIDLIVAGFLIATTCIRGYEVPPDMFMDGELYCRLWLSKLPLWGMLTASTYNLLALTVERYLAMIHPIWHKVNFTRRKAAAMMVFSWVIGLGYMTAFVVPTTVITDGFCRIYDEWPSPQIRNATGAFHAILLFFIPLGTLIFCYGRIALMLRKRVKVNPVSKETPATATVDATSTGQDQKDRWSKAHRNTVKTLILVSCCFAFCWVWNQTYYLLMNFGLTPDFTSNFYHFTVIAVFLNCCVNPIIYSLKYEQFQHEAKRLFLKRFHAEGNLTNATSITSNDTT